MIMLYARRSGFNSDCSLDCSSPDCRGAHCSGPTPLVHVALVRLPHCRVKSALLWRVGPRRYQLLVRLVQGGQVGRCKHNQATSEIF